MGILDRLTRSGRTPRERFVAQVLAELRRAGVRDAAYRPRQFAIVCDAGRDMSNWLFLAKAFSEYERNPGKRKQLVREFVATSLTPPPGPATFAEAEPDLRIALRPAARGGRTLRRPALPYLDEVVLSADGALDAEHPERWQVSTEEVFAAARAGSAVHARLPDSAALFGPSVLHVPDYGGDNLAGWILLDGWLDTLGEQVGGVPVAFAPSTLMLLVCVDEPRLVAQLFDLVAEEYGNSPRPLSPMGYTPDERGRAVPYEPPPGHPAHEGARRARRRLATDVAEHQRRLLGDPRLTECTLATRPDGTAFTSTVWSVGRPALLPQVDYVGVAQGGGRPSFVPWPVLVEADLLMEQIDFRPARFAVPTTPSRAALGYVHEHRVTL